MKSPLSRRKQGFFVCLGGVILLVSAAHDSRANPTRTPEEEIARLAKNLKPIPDDSWKLIAGDRGSQNYEIVKGDTLYDISRRLFGDAKYWPKIWALNNLSITNPHLIRPGNKIAFLAGTGTSLPSVAIQTDGSDRTPGVASTMSDAPADGIGAGSSQEWRRLPPQPWETVDVALPPEVDPLGFDTRSRIQFKKLPGFELDSVPASEKIVPQGTIVGSRAESNYVTLGDSVYIRTEGDLQVGDTYALTVDPSLLKARKSDRVGYSYLVIGSVKIIGVKDGLFIGKILSCRDWIPRGAMLITAPSKIRDVIPIPAPTPVEGILVLDKSYSTYSTAQHKQVFIDRGSEDGIQPGMIFRSYQYQDPTTEKKITESDFIMNADILVVQTSEKFSTGIVLSSLVPVEEGSRVVLLTDISDLKKTHSVREKSGDGTPLSGDSALDALDKLDGGTGLGKDEKKELDQLEKWNGNETEPDAEPSPSLTPLSEVPAGEELPEPPVELLPEPSPELNLTPEPAPEPTPEPTPTSEPFAEPTAESTSSMELTPAPELSPPADPALTPDPSATPTPAPTAETLPEPPSEASPPPPAPEPTPTEAPAEPLPSPTARMEEFAPNPDVAPAIEPVPTAPEILPEPEPSPT